MDFGIAMKANKEPKAKYRNKAAVTTYVGSLSVKTDKAKRTPRTQLAAKSALETPTMIIYTTLCPVIKEKRSAITPAKESRRRISGNIMVIPYLQARTFGCG